MNTALTASIKPQLRMIDGVKIRSVDSGGTQERVVLLTHGRHDRVVALADAEFLDSITGGGS